VGSNLLIAVHDSWFDSAANRGGSILL
jgi:hypothetical protein